MRRLVASGLTAALAFCYVGWSVRNGSATGAVLLVLPNVASNLAVASMLVWSIANKPRHVEDGWGIVGISMVASNLFIVLALAGVRLFAAHPAVQLQRVGAVGTVALVPLYVVAVFTLGRNLTVLPEANALVTTGVYRFSRHPLYAIYVAWYALQVLLCQSVAVLALAGLQIALQVVRARHEERLLGAEFPEYAAYRERVGWFAPRVRRPGLGETPAALPIADVPPVA